MSQRVGSALITGGAKRLGRAMALCLAARGYDLVIHYNSSSQDAEDLQADAAEFGATTHLLQGDLSSVDFMQSLIHSAKMQAPNLNLLINNASVFFPKTLEQTTPEDLDLFYNLHLKAPLLLSRDFARLCKQGNIINLVDTQIQSNLIEYLPYILSKRSLADLTTLSAKALGPDIRVNAIAPGHILKPVEGNPDFDQSAVNDAPLRRMGSVTDITAALESLLDNPYLTGQTLWVDGGLRLL